MPKTAAALVIGTEILTGKIQETNVHLLAKELFRVGIELRRVVVCPDEVDTIADDIRYLRDRHDWLFTSGGVGPTHDDVTLQAVAKAFSRPIVESEQLIDQIRDFVGEAKFNAGHRRMALVPEGAGLIASPEVPWPTVLMENVFVLPGLPRVFQMKMQLLRQHLAGSRPFLSRALYTLCRESELAETLTSLAEEHTEVAIGSYPVWGDDHYRVKLTVDGRDEDQIERAIGALRDAIDEEQLVPEPPPDDSDEPSRS